MRLIPTDERYYELFDALADEIVSASSLVRELFESLERRDELVPAIAAVEHRADAVAYELLDRLGKTFVTPLDSEDIHLLTTKLDTVVDLLDDTAQRAQMYRLCTSRPSAASLARLVERAGGHLRAAVRVMRQHDELLPHVRAVKAIEEEADAVYSAAVRELFDPGPGGERPNAIEVLKWKDVYGSLEEATDGCNHAAQLLESFALSYG
jgi:uncharacterized protein Yka (UPF0111/DUF47 family)